MFLKSLLPCLYIVKKIHVNDGFVRLEIEVTTIMFKYRTKFMRTMVFVRPEIEKRTFDKVINFCDLPFRVSFQKSLQMVLMEFEELKKK